MNATELPLWVTIFERIGPGSAVLVFTGALLWKVMPAVLGLLGSWRSQSEAVTSAIPRFEQSFERMIDKIDGIGDKLGSRHGIFENPAKEHPAPPVLQR